MDIQKLVGFNGVIYDKESELIGTLAGVNFLNETIIIAVENEDGESVLVEDVKMDNVELLPAICYFDGITIINRDILTIDGKLYEIELLESGKEVTLHLLNNELERVLTGWSIPVENTENELNRIKDNKDVELVANFYEVLGVFEDEDEEEAENELDFNIKIAKRVKGVYLEYLYVCNNKVAEEIDLIKVVFVGVKTIKEEAYERLTVSHEQYLQMVEAGELIEVSEGELQSYATGMLYGKELDTSGITCGDCNCANGYCEIEEEEEEDGEICRGCNEYVEDCDCL